MKIYRWTGRALLAAAVVLSVPSSSAAADGAAPISAEDDAKAIKFLAAGNKAFKVGKFAEAEEAYEKAFALKKVHDIAGNLGMTEFAQGKMREAAEHLAVGIRLFPITGEPALREQMQKTLDQCKRSVATVKVTVNVNGALMYVDNNLIGEAPLPDSVYLEQGEHTLEAKADGYKPMSQKVKADKGSAVEATFNLARLPKPKAQTVIVEVPVKRRSPVPGIIGGSVAAAAAGVGAALFAVSIGKKNDAVALSEMIGATNCTETGASRMDCMNLDKGAADVDRFHNVSIGTFIGAGVVAAASVAYLLWPAPKAPPSRRQGVRVTPTVGTGEGGMLISGAF